MNKLKLFMKDRENKILAEMVKGMTTQRIADKWGISRARVYQILHEAGWSARTIKDAPKAYPTVAEVEQRTENPGEWVKGAE
jgi:uncharacterized protein YjcR